MELDIIKLQTTWNDAAGSINSNYAKIADAIAQLKANGGGGGGGADIDLTDYATKVWVEANYAPLTSVQGFENRIGGLEGSVPQLNERVTTVAGEVSTLNEIVSTGKNNLLDRVNVIETDYVTSGNLESAINGIDLSAYLLKADLTKSRIQSTLGISDWALAATKPSYAWSEITSRPTALSQFTDDVVAGKYLPLSGGNIVSDKELILNIMSSSPNSYAMFYANGRNRASVGYYNGLGYIANEISYARIGVTDTGEPQYWDSYRTDANKYTLLHSGNIGNYNAGSATKLQTPRKLWGNDFDGTGDVSGNIISPRFETTAFSASTPKRKAALDAGGLIVYGADNSGWASGIYTYNPDDNTNIGAIAAAFGGASYTPQFYFYGGAYNDPFLKIYQNDRRIISSGLFMNIGKEISPYASNRAEIALINPNAEPSMLRLGSNGDVKWSIETRGSKDNYAFSIKSWTAATHCLRILNNGNVGIGNTSPTERLDVTGNIKASGNINATSITINGVTITASNGSITVNGNVFATGDITGNV